MFFFILYSRGPWCSHDWLHHSPGVPIILLQPPVDLTRPLYNYWFTDDMSAICIQITEKCCVLINTELNMLVPSFFLSGTGHFWKNWIFCTGLFNQRNAEKVSCTYFCVKTCVCVQSSVSATVNQLIHALMHGCLH